MDLLGRGLVWLRTAPNRRLKLAGAQRVGLHRQGGYAELRTPCARGDCARSLGADR